MRFNLSSRIKGIMRVSFANLLSLGVSLLTSFLLPMFISVKDYGYWQLFVMYTGYVGFFAFGFNDGVHLNYATNAYDDALASKFRTFHILLTVMSVVETVISIGLLVAIFGPEHDKFLVLLVSALNIIPVLVNGLFTYMNQATMRFKEYAWGNMVDKVIFTAIMVVMLLLGCSHYAYYIGAYTLSRYLVIVYHFFTSRKVFVLKPQPLKELKPEIISNFKDGFALMIAVLLNGSIIVGSRTLVESQFGIEEFGAFSFSIHTLVIASQFISAIASVFYPILKRCDRSELPDAYRAFDRASTLLSAILLLSYYPAVLLIDLLYARYAMILEYFMYVYPLFIFQCKSNLLIINTFKVKNEQGKLIFATGLAVVLNLVSAWIAYMLFRTVSAIAVATLVAYCLWYYLCQLWIYHEGKWKLHTDLFADAALTAMFIAVNALVTVLGPANFYLRLLLSFGVYVTALVIIFLLLRRYFTETVKNTMKYLKD